MNSVFRFLTFPKKRWFFFDRKKSEIFVAGGPRETRFGSVPDRFFSNFFFRFSKKNNLFFEKVKRRKTEFMFIFFFVVLDIHFREKGNYSKIKNEHEFRFPFFDLSKKEMVFFRSEKSENFVAGGPRKTRFGSDPDRF